MQGSGGRQRANKEGTRMLEAWPETPPRCKAVVGKGAAKGKAGRCLAVLGWRRGGGGAWSVCVQQSSVGKWHCRHRLGRGSRLGTVTSSEWNVDEWLSPAEKWLVYCRLLSAHNCDV